MINDSVKFADEDKAIKERIEAKHALQNYIHTMRSTIEDIDKLADKLSSEDRASIRDIADETEDWLNSNEDADKEAFEESMKDMQRICDPIIASIYNTSGG